MEGGAISLLSFLQSLYAIHSVPFPVNDSQTLQQLNKMVIIDNASEKELFYESRTPPSCMYQPPLSVFYKHLKDLWAHLRTVLDPVLYIHVFTTCQLFYCGTKNRWIGLTDPVDSSVSMPRKLPSSLKGRIVAKFECMYRTNWNKKFPLGVSNIFHSESAVSPEAFAKLLGPGISRKLNQQTIDALWATKLNCGRIDIENLLGVTCPLPKGFEDIKNASSDFVFRSVSAVPALTNSIDSASFLVWKIFHSIVDPHLLAKSTSSWRNMIRQYLALGRNERLAVVRGRNPELNFLLFKKIIVPLISYLFYATEFDSDRVVLFRRPVWDVIVCKCSEAMVNMLGLEKLSFSSVSQVRWIPKTSGFRPVVTQPKHVKEKTKRLLRYLNALRFLSPSKLGHSVFSRDALEAILEAFLKKRIPKKNQDIHFFTADVQNCFESIPFDQLENALIAFGDPDLCFSSVMVSITRGKTTRKRPIVFLRDDIDNLVDQLPTGSLDASKPVVIVHASQATLSHERLNYMQVRLEIMRIVRCTAYALNTKGSTTSSEIFSVVSQGLPQGSSFSVMLVSILYGYIDRTVLQVNPISTMFIRLVDDMLCLTTDQDEADRLIFLIGEEKIFGKINFEKFKCGKSPNPIDWAGFRILSDDFRNGRINVKFSASISKSSNKKYDSLVSLMSGCLPIFFSKRINSKSGLRENAHAAGESCGKRIKQWLLSSKNLCGEVDISGFVERMNSFANKRFKENPDLKKIFRASLLHSLS